MLKQTGQTLPEPPAVGATFVDEASQQERAVTVDALKTSFEQRSSTAG